MYRKSFYLTAVLSAALCAACSSGPTVMNSTHHKHEGEKPVSNTLTSKGATTHGNSDHGNPSHGAPGDANANHGTTQHYEKGHSDENHSDAGHSEMKSAPNAASQPYDLQFLDTMIAHHDGAIQMAKGATTKSTNADLKAFADKIVADQQREINELKKWRAQWFEGRPSALNMEMAGMEDSMEEMDAGKLNQATGDAYNLEFVNQMIPHHEGALVMAKEAAAKAEHAELKTLAANIIRAQEAEIRQMQTWKAQWAK